MRVCVVRSPVGTFVVRLKAQTIYIIILLNRYVCVLYIDVRKTLKKKKN